MLRLFRSRPDFLTNYHFKASISIIAICLLMVLAGGRIPLWFLPAILILSSTNILVVGVGVILTIAVLHDVSLASPIYIAFAATWCFTGTALIHNASHSNFRSQRLSRLVGEVAGFTQLVSFPEWAIVHVLHHANADDPVRDPHAPLEKTFWDFTIGMREQIGKVLIGSYFEIWGDTPETRAELKWLGRLSKIEHTAKICFWFLVLGPSLFTWFFAPMIFMKMLQNAWLNFATHRNGEVLNLQDGPYRFINFVSFGLYYHGNHHKNPKLFNPSQMSESVNVKKSA